MAERIELRVRKGSESLSDSELLDHDQDTRWRRESWDSTGGSDAELVGETRFPTRASPGLDPNSWAARCSWLGLGAVLFNSRINWLLLACPFALMADLWWGEGATFAFSLIGLVPLAAQLGYLTEQVALHTNETLGGLLNATFGNLTELVISAFALKHGLLRIIQVSLLGSILSNMLLVLGTAFLLGGYRFRVQSFNKDHSIISSGLLMLAVMGITLPAVLLSTNVGAAGAELSLSRFTSIVLLLVYFAFLYFQLRTHRDLFESADDDEEEEEKEMELSHAIFWLAVVTGLVSVFSEFLVGTIEGASKQWDIPQTAIGAILLPIVGNAVEHYSAVSAAYKNKMDLCLGVAIGSSTQIAMFGVPVMVIIAWMVGQPLSLYFRVFETATVFSSVIIVSFLTSDGQSNWMHGLMLVTAYILVAAGFYYHVDDDADAV